MALLGIVRTPSSPCVQKCACHDEYSILKRKLEGDEEDTKTVRRELKMRMEEAITTMSAGLRRCIICMACCGSVLEKEKIQHRQKRDGVMKKIKQVSEQ